ncbi:unnamed protein product, partial [Rotaria sordida]
MAMTTSNLNSTKTITRRSTVSDAKIVHEQVLSQELGQFSPFKINSTKKQITRFPIEIILSKTIGSEWQSISDYLCSKNPSFEKKLRTILPSTMNLDEIRDIAILMHKIMSIDIVQSLWIVYRKYGMEEIQSKRPINVSDTKFWPKEVSSLMKKLKNDNIIDESSCLIFANQCLQELYNKKEHYRHELNVKTTRLSGYNFSMEYTIEKFVQQGLQSLHIEINEHIATVQYHYTNIIFQQTYFAQNSNTNQNSKNSKYFLLHMDFNTIDLTRAEQATSLLINNKQQEYQSRTLLDKNNGRYAYLPIFPTEYVGPNECLLLANVSVSRLAPHQINRRQYGAYTFDALMLMNKYNYSDEFSLSEQDANELASRLQVGKSIITFNAQRLRSICHTLLAFHESFRRHVLCKSDVALKEPTPNSKQMAMAL